MRYNEDIGSFKRKHLMHQKPLSNTCRGDDHVRQVCNNDSYYCHCETDEIGMIPHSYHNFGYNYDPSVSSFCDEFANSAWTPWTNRFAPYYSTYENEYAWDLGEKAFCKQVIATQARCAKTKKPLDTMSGKYFSIDQDQVIVYKYNEFLGESVPDIEIRVLCIADYDLDSVCPYELQKPDHSGTGNDYNITVDFDDHATAMPETTGYYDFEEEFPDLAPIPTNSYDNVETVLGSVGGVLVFNECVEEFIAARLNTPKKSKCDDAVEKTLIPCFKSVAQVVVLCPWMFSNQDRAHAFMYMNDETLNEAVYNIALGLFCDGQAEFSEGASLLADKLNVPTMIVSIVTSGLYSDEKFSPSKEIQELAAPMLEELDKECCLDTNMIAFQCLPKLFNSVRDISEKTSASEFCEYSNSEYRTCIENAMSKCMEVEMRGPEADGIKYLLAWMKSMWDYRQFCPGSELSIPVYGMEEFSQTQFKNFILDDCREDIYRFFGQSPYYPNDQICMSNVVNMTACIATTVLTHGAKYASDRMDWIGEWILDEYEAVLSWMGYTPFYDSFGKAGKFMLVPDFFKQGIVYDTIKGFLFRGMAETGAFQIFCDRDIHYVVEKHFWSGNYWESPDKEYHDQYDKPMRSQKSAFVTNLFSSSQNGQDWMIFSQNVLQKLKNPASFGRKKRQAYDGYGDDEDHYGAGSAEEESANEFYEMMEKLENIDWDTWPYWSRQNITDLYSYVSYVLHQYETCPEWTSLCMTENNVDFCAKDYFDLHPILDLIDTQMLQIKSLVKGATDKTSCELIYQEMDIIYNQMSSVFNCDKFMKDYMNSFGFEVDKNIEFIPPMLQTYMKSMMETSFRWSINNFGHFCGPNMTEWSSWSVCSASCDGGVQSRTRSCDKTTENFPGECDLYDSDPNLYHSTSETRPCNFQTCEQCIWKNKDKVLDCSNMKLTQVDAIFDTKKLDISNGKLRITAVKGLDLSDNEIDDVIALNRVIKKLPGLKSINLSGNQLRNIPNFSESKHLRSINLNRNNITALDEDPKECFYEKRMYKIHLSIKENPFTSFPFKWLDWKRMFKSLTY